MNRLHSNGAFALILVFSISLSGCLAAAAGAAGAAAGIAYSDRGAQTHVDAAPARVATATEAAFRTLGITVTERKTEPPENEIEIKGKDGDLDVVVDIEGNRDAGRTHIEVTASKNVVDYDKSRAEAILRGILNRL